ncbi:hypothetical protein F5148DRAFT_459316 [Russula earlei]|uniref:Uncharacterized protein n=1 Tax=Russula earlei TaxID=71964 RepID=A0ACC0TYJ0_9AGAM|nr:hypothetical protein F5148DRAFT_459316 [Russula earlei]
MRSAAFLVVVVAVVAALDAVAKPSHPDIAAFRLLRHPGPDLHLHPRGGGLGIDPTQVPPQCQSTCTPVLDTLFVRTSPHNPALSLLASGARPLTAPPRRRRRRRPTFIPQNCTTVECSCTQANYDALAACLGCIPPTTPGFPSGNDYLTMFLYGCNASNVTLNTGGPAPASVTATPTGAQVSTSAASEAQVSASGTAAAAAAASTSGASGTKAQTGSAAVLDRHAFWALGSSAVVVVVAAVMGV